MKLLGSLLLLPLARAAPLPKMLAEPAYAGKPLGPATVSETVSSSSATILGECSPGAPFDFTVYGPSGVGAIGVSSAAAAGIAVSLTLGEVVLGTETQQFFAGDAPLQGDEDMVAFSLEYSAAVDDVAAKEGSAAQLTCATATSVIVLLKDGLDVRVEAVVTSANDGEHLQIVSAKKATRSLQGSTRAKKNGGQSPVSFDSETADNIRIKRQPNSNAKGLALVDGFFTSDDGYTVRRTLLHESKPKPANTRNVPVKCCDITDDGDIEIGFPGMLAQHESLRVDLRLGLTVDGSRQPTEVVDVTAFLTDGNTLQVHGGWVRNAVAAEGLQDAAEGWDVVVMDAVLTDPENEYKIVGQMKQPNQNGIANAANRPKLSQRPSDEEVAISEDMKVGKRPTEAQRVRHLGHGHDHGRDLQSGQKKILVHGYCAGSNPFPINQFSNAIAFYDSAAPASWSLNTFAVKISNFAANNGIQGCGCIAHSQGGAACLHLYSYYWSCLDYATYNNRMIQSVGTPYQGTALAGSIAAIGDIFGAGCGSNNDLTYSGASAWLSGIPSWARSQVRYYSTSFNDRWWAYDYCHLASDVLLSDPDDGTTERAQAQLSGATNGGHKEGWCHTTGMRDPPQYTDSSRNSEMNANASY